jgi:hypothetical protein
MQRPCLIRAAAHARRLYTEARQPLLAERCLAAARSHDPASAAAWEAMAALAALSPAGARASPRCETPAPHSAQDSCSSDLAFPCWV